MSDRVQPPGPRRPRPRRGSLRRLAEVRGWTGGYKRPHLTARMRTVDGVALTGSFLPAAGPAPDLADAAVLLLHGFAAHRRKPAYARFADTLAESLPVLALDLRGHGDSGGHSTLGDHEVADAAAGHDWLAAHGYRRVVAVGVSMGATTVLHAAGTGLPVAAVVAVSAPARFQEQPGAPPLVRLHRLWHSPWRRRGLTAVTGVRLGPPELWGPPPHPVELAAAIHAPLLVVHGADDAYFPLDDAHALVAAAAGPAALWAEPAGFGHAEDGLRPPLVADLARAVVTALRTGRFPAAR